MPDETPEVTAARTAVEAAAQQFANAISEQGSPFVTSWILAPEFTTATMDDDGDTADHVLVPTTQTRATSRGLLGLALDHYTRG